MKTSISFLYQFQASYLIKLLGNIPNELLYAKQFEGYNSPGWLLGHICVEAEDVFNYYDQNDGSISPQWIEWFRNTDGSVNEEDILPTKEELISVFRKRYDQLLALYESLNDEQRTAPAPSKMLGKILPTSDSWVAHHLTTHISIHCGNIVVWKKLMNIPVGGY